MRYVLAAGQFSVIIEKYSTGQKFGHITIFNVFKHVFLFFLK